MWKVKRNTSGEIRSVFSEACANREMLVIATQYLKFESHFVHLDGNEVHARTTVGGEHALAALGACNVNLRFSHKPDFMEASTKLIGLGSYEDSETIKFVLPSSICISKGRRSPRITELGNASATFRIDSSHSIPANMVDISTGGAKLTLTGNLPHGKLGQNDRIMLSIHLSEKISINTGAIIRHINNMTFGVEFNPDLTDSDVNIITDWALGKQEERKPAIKENLDEDVILLITHDDELDADLSELLSEGRVFYRVMPDVSLVQNALDSWPGMVILHLTSGNMEGALLKSLIENIPSDMPILLLGSDIESDLLFEIGVICKATVSTLWMPGRGRFLQRLVTGLLRKKSGGWRG